MDLLWLLVIVAIVVIGIALIPAALIVLWYLLPWTLMLAGVVAVALGLGLGGKLYVEGGVFIFILGGATAFGQFSN